LYEVMIVGCGNIGGGFDHENPETETPFSHAGAYHCHGGFVITACVDPNVERRATFMQRWQVARGFDSIEDALGAGMRPAVISICSPTSAHLADARAALKLSPRLIFCEKPVTPKTKETRALLDECEAQGVAFVVNYTRRWDPSVLILADEIRSGRWGAVRSASGCYSKGVNNNGSHMIDLLGLLLGDLQIIAVGNPRADFFADDPSIPALLLAAGDVSVTLNIGHANDYALFELELVTEKAVIRMEEGGLSWRIRQADVSTKFRGYRSPIDEYRQAGTLGQAMLAAVGEIESILLSHARITSSSGANALRVQTICEAISCHALGSSFSKRGVSDVD
jgi:predicted dehydrogenase